METFLVLLLIVTAIVALPAWGLHRLGYFPSGTIGGLMLFAFVWSLL